MAEIKSLLDDVIEEEIAKVKYLSSGTDEKSAAIRDLSILHKLRIEEIKAQADVDEKHERRVMDSEKRESELALRERELNCKDADHTDEEMFQERQLREQIIDRRVRTCVQIGELLIPLIFYGIWMRMGFAFETDNSFTSVTFKNLLNRFKPTKKG